MFTESSQYSGIWDLGLAALCRYDLCFRALRRWNKTVPFPNCCHKVESILLFPKTIVCCCIQISFIGTKKPWPKHNDSPRPKAHFCISFFFFFLPLEHQTLLKGDSDMFVARSFVEDGSCGFTAEQQQLRSGRPHVTAKTGQNTSKCPQKLLSSSSTVHFYTADPYPQHVASAHHSNNTLVLVFRRRAGSNKTHWCKMIGVCYVVKKLRLCLAYS